MRPSLIGVAADNRAVCRRADDIELHLIVCFSELRPHQRDRRLRRIELCVAGVRVVLRLLIELLRRRILGDETSKALLFAFSRTADFRAQDLRFRLRYWAATRIARQARVVVCWLRQDLVRLYEIAFLNEYLFDTPGARRCINKAAFDIDLAGGNRGVGVSADRACWFRAWQVRRQRLPHQVRTPQAVRLERATAARRILGRRIMTVFRSSQ